MPGHWVRSKDVVWEELEGEAVLVSSSTEQTWVLNPTASFVWRHCDGRSGLEDMARSLANAGRQEIVRIREEIAAFCEELAGLGLLQPVPCVAGPAARQSAAYRFAGIYVPPGIRLHCSFGGGRRGRASPRGISGPG